MYKSMSEYDGKVIKIKDAVGFAAVANDGIPLTDELIAEFSELKVVRVYQAGEPDMSTGATGKSPCVFISCVPVSKLNTMKYDEERDSYEFEWNFFEEEMKFFEVVS